MLSHFGTYLRIDLHLNKEKPIILGVSGGPDSLYLLDLMVQHGFSVIVAHLDHQLRPQSADEARGVGVIAEHLGVPFVLEEMDVASLAEDQHLSLEEAARIARYRFLFRQATDHGAQAVAVGHNAEDQVETILMHLLRGSGLSGLKGMQPISLPTPWNAEIPLVRPLLSVWRKEILEYCHQRNLTPIYDDTNRDTQFFRNRLRHDLIPHLDGYVPGVKERLWRMADILAEDDTVIEEVVVAARNHCLKSKGNGFISFDTRVLTFQPLAVQRRLIRWAVSQIRPDIRDLDYGAVQRALSIVSSLSPAKQHDLSMGIRAFVEDDCLYVATWEANLPNVQWPQIDTAAEAAEFQIPGEMELLNGWRLQSVYVRDPDSARRQALENHDPYRAWLDLGDGGTGEATFILRTRYDGDQFQPLGMGGKSTKLSHFMLNQKMPRRARAGWPLICVGDEIAWVPGYRIGHGYRMRQKTSGVFYLHLIPPA